MCSNAAYSAVKRTRDVSTELRGHAITIQSRQARTALQPIAETVTNTVIMNDKHYSQSLINPSYVLDKGASSPAKTPYIASRTMKTSTSQSIRPATILKSRPPTMHMKKHAETTPLIIYPEPAPTTAFDLIATLPKAAKPLKNSLRPMLESISPSHFFNHQNENAFFTNYAATSSPLIPIMIKYPPSPQHVERQSPTLIIQQATKHQKPSNLLKLDQ